MSAEVDAARALFSGFVSGAVVAFATVAIALWAMSRSVRWRTRIASLGRLPLPLVGVVIVNVAVLGWTLLGLLLGAAYIQVADPLRFGLIVHGLVLIAVLAAAFVLRGLNGAIWATAIVAAFAFGVLLPRWRLSARAEAGGGAVMRPVRASRTLGRSHGPHRADTDARRKTLELTLGLQGSVLDMHVHSAVASSDSTLNPHKLPELGRAAGLTGANISEHDKMWDRHLRAEYRERHTDFLVNFGMEISTDLGHMLVVGLPAYISGIRRAELLREELDAVGGFLIVAHPFRHVFDNVTAMRKDSVPFELTPAEAAPPPRLPARRRDSRSPTAATRRARTTSPCEVRARAGAADHRRQRRALRERHRLLRDGFERELRSEAELLEELHAGRFEAIVRSAGGDFARFEPGVVEAVAAARG